MPYGKNPYGGWRPPSPSPLFPPFCVCAPGRYTSLSMQTRSAALFVAQNEESLYP